MQSKTVVTLCDLHVEKVNRHFSVFSVISISGKALYLFKSFSLSALRRVNFWYSSYLSDQFFFLFLDLFYLWTFFWIPNSYIQISYFQVSSLERLICLLNIAAPKYNSWFSIPITWLHISIHFPHIQLPMVFPFSVNNCHLPMYWE